MTVKRYAGKGIPKVVSLELHGELVEGNVIKGQAVVAWCGGTPGKCITRWVMVAAISLLLHGCSNFLLDL